MEAYMEVNAHEKNYTVLPNLHNKVGTRDSSDTKHINKKMMENRHFDDVTERIFKLDILF